jgi:hypothetical protein
MQLKLIETHCWVRVKVDSVFAPSSHTTIADMAPSMICDHKQHVIEKRFL